MNNKTIKKYVDGKWITLVNPDVTVVQEIESGKVSDTNVVVTNYNYAEEGEETTLDSTLSTISDDISKLQRNVSWLAEHGGGGGSGSGGTFNPYGFEIDTPQVVNGGDIFLKKEEMASITVKFRITGGYDGDVCRYQYVYDGGQPSALKDLEVNKYETIIFDNSQSTSKRHDLKISGINPYGTNIASFSFHAYLSNLSITFDGELTSDIFYIFQNDTVGELPLVVENGLIGSETVISGSSSQGGQPTYYSFTNRTTDPQRVVLKFWDMFDRQSVIPGTDYVITFSAFAQLGTTILTDTTDPLRVRVINPTVLTVVIGSEGSGGETEIEVQQNALLNYNFNAFAPANIGRYVYYSAVMQKANGENELILGKYYDENTHEDGAGIDSNPTISINTIKTETYKLTDSLYSVKDVIHLHVRVWSADKSQTSTASKAIKIIPESRAFWERQYYNRTGGHTDPDTLFACWNKGNVVATSKFKWNSIITNYYPISITTPTTIEATLDILNGNNASGAQTSTGTPFFRVQNHAYGKVDFSNYESEIQSLFTNNQTFTISVTIKDNNQTGTDHTLFLWGTNNQDGELTNNGFRIDTDKIYWSYREDISGQISQKALTCSMPRGEKTTVDFVYGGNTLKIYKNGILNTIKRISKIDFDSALPNFVYFGVNNTASQTLNNYADIDIYEFAIYTRALNDMQIAINGKNARIDGSDDAAIDEYNNWLTRNFISSPVSGETPESEFFKSIGGKDSFNEYFSLDGLTKIKSVSKIPTIVLNFGPDTTFTEEFFYDSYTSGDVTKEFQSCSGTYYDPNKRSDIDLVLKAALQGTSTLLYRVKNLELMMDEYVEIESVNVPVLFQPKNIWMPERQFTLKADIVDSAHANNAVIGGWINTNAAKIGLGDNPAMEQFAKEENKPLYVDLNGEPVDHYSEKQQKNINYHEDVTIKHTLEGFPVLLFIRFRDVSPEHAATPFKFIGIYSFNLGRYSYYNMGMRFLESFSRLDENRNDVGCPAVIKYYKEKSSLGSIRANDVYSFEFDNDANENNHNLPMWSQNNSSITYSLGEFKYPENVTENDPIWTQGLKNLFDQTSTWLIDSYNGDAPTYVDESGVTRDLFYPIYPYRVIGTGSDKQYERISDTPIRQNNDGYESLRDALDISTAAHYFMIANAFGMTDSLGKNMTIRSWNGGNTWYTCFYDMDTALGLANDGAESILVTASIDRLKTVINSETQTTTIKTTYHDDASQYAQHLSKLWGILRSRSLLYAARQLNTPYYETIWQLMRSGNGALSSAENFVEMMKERVETCGELIFDCDYNSKYVQQGTSEESEASQFLHGTRVDYVRDWLKRHFYYLDGLFDVTKYQMTGTYKDSPYYGEEFMASVNFLTAQRLPFNVRATTPSFIKISVGNAEPAKFYIDKENTDIPVYVANSTSPNAQIVVRGSSVLSKFDGLQSGFQQISTSNKKGVIKSLNSFNVSSSSMLNKGPFNNTSPFFNENNSSALDAINLSSTKLIDENKEYSVNLIKFDKLLNIDISNSDVKSITLPETALESIRISGSKITTFTLNDQPKITGVSFDGCNKIGEIKITNCNNYKSFSISDKPLLVSTELSNNDALESVTIDGCNALKTMVIANNRVLKSISITNCKNSNLQITIFNSPLLESIVINDVISTNVIKLPSRDQMSNVTTFDLRNCFFIGGIQYGDDAVETVGDDVVFDISPMGGIDGENVNMSYITTLKYLRVKNVEYEPFKFLDSSFRGCDNLTRIFGNIVITSNTSFRYYKNFHLNDATGQGFDPSGIPFSTDTGRTNVCLDTADLSYCFENTSCNISDVYQIFGLINSAVTDIHGMFGYCNNIIAINNELPENLFVNCASVSNISELFQNCKNLTTLIKRRLLYPLTDTLVNFDNVFVNCDVYVRVDGDEYSIFPPNNKIKSVVGFNLKYDIYDDGYLENYEVEDWKILFNLTEIESIENSFSNLNVKFGNGTEIEDSHIFDGKTRLKRVVNSFRNFSSWETLTVKHLFGGTGNTYPSGLVNISNSFVNPNGSSISIAIGNTFFGNSNSTLEDITGILLEVNKVIDFDDCDNMPFPYKVFSGCSKITNVSNFFNGMDCISGETVNTITLPSYISGNVRVDILGDCVNVVDASYLFANLKNVNYSLVGKGFINNSLENVAHMFDNLEYRSMIGGIPFKLFYEEENGVYKKTITNMSYVFRNCASTGQTYYNASILSEEDLYEANENYVPGSSDEDTKYPYVWNKFAYDGSNVSGSSNPFFNRITATTIYNSGDIAKADSTAFPDEFKENYSPTAKTATILDIDDIGKTPTGEDYTIGDKTAVFSIRNFFCPPDIFRYCVNAASTNVNYAFAGTSFDKYGLFGTIPPYIFEPIKSIGELDGVFSNCKVLLPYSWGYMTQDPEQPTGELILIPGNFLPPSIFDGMDNLYSVNSLFAQNRMWGMVHFNLGLIPAAVFTVASLFKQCSWLSKSGFGNTTLIHLGELSDVGSFLQGAGPTTISSNLLNSLNNRKIASCAYFMESNRETTGNGIPDFWNFPLLANADKSRVIGAFYNIDSALSEQIPNKDGANYWYVHI